MKVEINGEYKPIPHQIVDYLWNECDAEEQAKILLDMLAIRENNYPEWLKQLAYIREELDTNIYLRDVAKEEIIDFCDEIKEYLVEKEVE